jgi:hypothetical protein
MMTNWTDETGQEHQVVVTYTHKMYRMSGRCECGWSQDYVVAPHSDKADGARTILEALHDQFVKVGV